MMNTERKKQIEEFAMEILAQYGITGNPGKQLDVIARGEDIDLVAYPNWDVETCGRLMRIDGKHVIFYNDKHTPEMQAFTIAHELGHYFLRHLTDGEKEKICLNRDLQRIEAKYKPQEVEANFFAACLLMPFDQLYSVYRSVLAAIKRSDGPIYVDTQPCNIRDYKICISMMQKHFLASATAIRFRMMNLGFMTFNIPFKQTEDRGISLARYLADN